MLKSPATVSEFPAALPVMGVELEKEGWGADGAEQTRDRVLGRLGVHREAGRSGGLARHRADRDDA